MSGAYSNRSKGDALVNKRQGGLVSSVAGSISGAVVSVSVQVPPIFLVVLHGFAMIVRQQGHREGRAWSWEFATKKYP